MRARALVVVAALAVALSQQACSAGGCDNQRCAPPTIPSYTLRLVVNGEHVARGGAASVSLQAGRPTTFSLTIDRAVGVRVSDVYLIVNSDHWTNGPGAPSGRVKILTHSVGLLSVGKRVVATWLPAHIFGTSKIYISARFDLGDARLGETAARVQISP